MWKPNLASPLRLLLGEGYRGVGEGKAPRLRLSKGPSMLHPSRIQFVGANNSTLQEIHRPHWKGAPRANHIQLKLTLR